MAWFGLSVGDMAAAAQLSSQMCQQIDAPRKPEIDVPLVLDVDYGETGSGTSAFPSFFALTSQMPEQLATFKKSEIDLPPVLCVYGITGSGKSALARSFAFASQRRWGCDRLENDSKSYFFLDLEPPKSVAKLDSMATSALILDRIHDLEALESDSDDGTFQGQLKDNQETNNSMNQMFFDALPHDTGQFLNMRAMDEFQNNIEGAFSETHHDLNTLELWLMRCHRDRWRTQTGQIPLCDLDAA